MLSLNNVNNTVSVDKSICAKQLCFPQYSWTFFKSKERNCDLNFKGAYNRYITLYFDEEWLQKNLVPNATFAEAGLNRFIRSDKERYIVCPLPENEPVLDNFSRFDQMMNIGGSVRQVDFLSLKYAALNLIFGFFKCCKEQNIIAKHIAVDYKDKFSIHKIAHYLITHLSDKFPGINFLANKFNISETKLKTEFKHLFGKPVYQYFQEKQMQLAKEILTENQLLVKEIAYKFGYENASKFAAAFKKHHVFLPSELTELQ